MSKQSPNTPPSGDATPIGALTKADGPQIVGVWPDCPSWCQHDTNYDNCGERYHSAVLGEVSFSHDDEMQFMPTLEVTQIDAPKPELGGIQRFEPTFVMSLKGERENVTLYFDNPTEVRQFTNRLLELVDGIEAAA